MAPAGAVRLQRSYWVVSYEQGSIRRGLSGEVLSWFVGRPSAAVVDAVTVVVALLAAASVLVLIEMLLRTRTGHGCALALLIASSPFVYDFFFLERRPELLDIPTLVFLGFRLLRRPDRARLAVSGLVGVVFAVLVLMHEAVVLLAVSWALILVVLVAQSSASETNSRPVGWMMALVAIPPVASLGILSFAMASPEVVEQLRAEAPWLGPHSVFDFLADRPGDALARVVGLEKHSWAATLLVGGGLLVLHGAWVSRWSGQHLLVWLREVRPRLLGAVPVLALVVGVVVLFATGEDWLRWCGELVVSTFVLLTGEPAVPDRPRPSAIGSVPLPRAAPIAATLLACARLVDVFIGPRGLARVLLGVE